MNVSMLMSADARAYQTHMRLADSESGEGGRPHFHPYGRDESIDIEEAIHREQARWARALDEPGWRRAWGLYHSAATGLVGCLYLAGGTLRSEMHRVEMGMGVLRTHHRQGGGSLLLSTAVEWATSQSQISWIDLGVFLENTAAVALYRDFGFIERGRTPDRFRVDGHQIEDISMSVFVA